MAATWMHHLARVAAIETYDFPGSLLLCQQANWTPLRRGVRGDRSTSLPTNHTEVRKVLSSGNDRVGSEPSLPSLLPIGDPSPGATL
jgi:hypothetical protein